MPGADVGRQGIDEKQLRLTQYALDHFSDCAVWLDMEGRIVYVNDMACRVLGYSRDELLSMHIWDIDVLFKPEKLRETWEYIQKAGWMFLQSIVRTREGREFPVEVHASYTEFEGTALIVAFVHDITERKLAEEAMAESEEKFRKLADTALTAIFLVQNNKFIYANPTASRITGFANDEILRMNFWDLVHPEFREEIKKYGIDMLYGKEIPARFEIKFVNKVGEGRWCDVTVAPIRYRGKVAGVVTAMDVTERKRAQEALAESEEKFRVLSEMSPTAIFMYQGDKLIYANPTAVALTGYSMGELLTKNFWDMIHTEYREMVKTYGLARQRGEPAPTRYEIRYITKGGEERWAEFTASYIVYRGRPAGIVTAIDTTERKRAEIALREAKSQAELYVDLMGHDINNMNQAAMGFIELACEKIKKNGSLGKEDADLLASAIGPLRNSAGLIDSVRKLQKEKKGGLQPHVIDIRDVLAAVKDRYAAIPGREVVISYTATCPCKVIANELLRDVFSNLVGNAIKHSRGAIAISVSLTAEQRQGKLFCRVAVEDTGPGIPDERKKAIFERASEDRAIMGRGLGLYLVKTLVDDYHGQVWVEDRVPGDYRKGARFVVLLPAVEEPGKDAAEGAGICGG